MTTLSNHSDFAGFENVVNAAALANMASAAPSDNLVEDVVRPAPSAPSHISGNDSVAGPNTTRVVGGGADELSLPAKPLSKSLRGALGAAVRQNAIEGTDAPLTAAQVLSAISRSVAGRQALAQAGVCDPIALRGGLAAALSGTDLEVSEGPALGRPWSASLTAALHAAQARSFENDLANVSLCSFIDACLVILRRRPSDEPREACELIMQSIEAPPAVAAAAEPVSLINSESDRDEAEDAVIVDEESEHDVANARSRSPLQASWVVALAFALVTAGAAAAWFLWSAA